VKNNKAVQWILRLIKGGFIGTGFILPGVSGGALAAIFGIYERIIDFMSCIADILTGTVMHVFRRKTSIRHTAIASFGKDVLFFVPIGFGGLFSIVLCSFVLDFFFDKYMVEILWFFVGCIVGTLPALWQQAVKKGQRPVHVAILVASAILGYLFLSFGKELFSQVTPNFVNWMGAGALIALGMLVPGLSPSNFLLYMGLYTKMIAAFKTLDFAVIFPIGIGGIVCVLLLSKAVQWLLKKIYTGMFHFVLGIVMASTLIVLPLPFNYTKLELDALQYQYTPSAILIGIVCAVAGIALGWWMSCLEDAIRDPKQALTSASVKE
jgi:putative membrane protein